MILSDLQIVEAMKDGSVYIDPFDGRNLGTNSYDVRLGEWYYREQPPANYGNALEAYNPYNEKEVSVVWGKPQFSSGALVVNPGESILAHTQEFIGGRNNITTMMKARSSFGRNFISVCLCAGLGDVGYINRWTMEITNRSRYRSIQLQVGMRIAQIVFLQTGPTKDYSLKGKYQHTSKIEELRESWKASDMLPKLYRDWELREA